MGLHWVIWGSIGDMEGTTEAIVIHYNIQEYTTRYYNIPAYTMICCIDLSSGGGVSCLGPKGLRVGGFSSRFHVKGFMA